MTMMRRRFITIGTVLLASLVSVWASTTQLWQQDRAEEFEQGTPSNVTIRSDGYIQLAPKLDELYQGADAFFWSMAEDSRGRVFLGSGNEGKVYVYDGREGRLFFDAPEMEVHALAVDAEDNLYVGTSPDGKVYRVAPDGESRVFYDPPAKYIWALAIDRQGRLYVGTGEDGVIYRVDRRGQASVFFDSEEKHIRCLAIDAQGNLLAGSEGQARLFRLTPDGQPFILYDAPVAEITSIAVAPDGTIYAAGIGAVEKEAEATTTTTTSSLSTVITISATSSGQSLGQQAGVASATKTKTEIPGSRIFRITPDGFPEEIWKSDKATVFSVAFWPSRGVLAGTGDEGVIYQIEPDGTRSALLTRVEPSQVTALLVSRRRPLVYAATSNLARLFALESGYAREGSLISSVKDTSTFSQWGLIRWRQRVPAGTSVTLFTRSGNTREPDNTWSPWSGALTRAGGEKITSPPARFIQWKLVLTSSSGAETPVVDSVELAYLPRNVAPRIDSLILQPPDIAFEKVPSYGTIQAVTTVSSTTSSGGSASSQAQTNRTRRQWQKASQVPPRQVVKEGFRTITWTASDANDDELVYSVYIRGEGETAWKLMKDELTDTFYSWDTTQLPDGYYRVKIVASDEPSNPPDRALRAERVTEWFEIDNTPPRIEMVSVDVQAEGSVRLRFAARDGATPITMAEYLVDNIDPRQMLSVDGILDAPEERFDLVIDGLSPGEHTITVRVRDGADNVASARAIVTVGGSK